jgi:hypothetical protein
VGRRTTGGDVTGNGMPSPRPRPIIFSGPMVRAITRETDPKTHTRRPVTGMALTWLDQFLPEFVADPANHLSPYGHAGDRLWVRETFAGDNLCGWVYRAEHPDADIAAGELDDGEQSLRRWTPSIHMPREASRLKLDVVAVRIERLLAISVDDCFAEGIEPMRCPECHLAATACRAGATTTCRKHRPRRTGTCGTSSTSAAATAGRRTRGCG